MQCVWYSQNTFEICGSLVQKKKLKINYFPSYKLPKLESTNCGFQGTLGVNWLQFL
jgi:hypothetical protein